MHSEHRDDLLPWRHRPVPELVRLAWPIAVSMLSYSVMTVVSTLFVGRLGAAALAGVGLGGVVAFALIAFGFGGLRSVKVLVSQATGARRTADIPAHVAASVWLALSLGVLSLVVGRFVILGLPALSASRQAGAAAADYVAMRNLGAPLALVAVALREARYGQGDSRAPLLSALAANLANMGLDALFILGLGLGVRGAGLATALAHAVEVAFLLVASRSPGIGWRAARVRHVVAALRLGLPLGLQFLLEVGSFTVLVVLLARFGEVDVAAHQIALQLTHLSFLPAFAVGEAVSVLIGQAVGAGQDGLVRTLARKALLIASVYTGLCALVFVLFAGPITAAFSDSARVRSTAMHLLWIAAAFQVFDGANVVARSALRGTGDVRFPAVIAVGASWLCLPPLTLLFGDALGLGAVGGWLALSVEITLGAALFWARLERGRWRAAAERSRAELASEPPPALDGVPASAA